MQITIENVPQYLINSELYKNLEEIHETSRNNIFEIELLYLKETTCVNNINDLLHLFHSLRYWIIEYKDYPYQDIFNFIEQHKDLNYENMYETFPELEIINEIRLLTDKNNEYIFIESAKNGYLLLLKYMHINNNYKLSEKIINNVVMYGHINCLKYLHENNCLWNNNIFTLASSRGHINCLRYIIKNYNCKIPSSCIYYTILHNKLECLKYLLSNNLNIELISSESLLYLTNNNNEYNNNECLRCYSKYVSFIINKKMK